MLNIEVKGTEIFDEIRECFIEVKPQTLRLEHSLISISKWESKWKKPFLSEEVKTREEELDYIRCMCIDKEPDIETLNALTMNDMKRISDYINDSMTATWFKDRTNRPPKGSRAVTSELIYYWMTALQIPFTCERWHLNRLLTLVHICDIEQSPKKKMDKKSQMAHQRSLNAARRARHGTRG